MSVAPVSTTISVELCAAATKIESPEIKDIMFKAAWRLAERSPSREASELRLENHYLSVERDALRKFICALLNDPDALSEAWKTCEKCEFFLGMGDFSLCCCLKHDLCYSDTPACSRFLPKIEKKKKE